MSKQTRIRVTAALVIMVAAGLYFSKHEASDVPPTHVAAAAIASNARTFTLGTLQFSACELPQRNSGATTSAFCAPFSVAENRATSTDSGTRNIALNLALIKSDAERADTDIVVFLAGGPGQAAVQTYPQISAALSSLRKHHHILLLDQRGTGKSNPLTCKEESAAQTQPEADSVASDGTDSGELDPVAFRASVTACLQEVRKLADPAQYTTTAAVEDLEQLRHALGDVQFDLVGVSYGTRVAQQYVMRHPDGVRSVVLDSVAPNELVFGAEFAQNLDAALKLQFTICTQSKPCAAAFGDPYASLLQLRDTLRSKPLDYSFRDPLTFVPTKLHLTQARLAGLVRMFAYSPETASLLPLSIAEGLKGNFTPLAGQTQLLQEDMAASMDGGMQASVICSEDADLLKDDPQDAATLLGSRLIDAIRAQCAVWPHGTRPADFHAPFTSDKPILILSGAFDPVTPPRYAEAVANHLSNARILLAKGQGHNVIGRGCIPKLVGEFVDALQPKTLDISCIDALGPLPALIDFNGSAP